MTKYPVGIQDFEKVRTEGFEYVDKTASIYSLATAGTYFFLSRPRRFGKSLLLSTMKAYFQGKRALFDGLAISELEHDWVEYPVLYLDLNVGAYDSKESLRERLDQHLRAWEKEYGLDREDFSIESRFGAVIQAACEQTGQRVVVLVDEYDKPMLQAIGKPDLQDEFRTILKAFYGNLKSCDRFIRFAFLTGVTKFGKVSVFSDLNNLTDISMLPQYAEICGITEPELHRQFDSGVRELAAANGLSADECYSRMKTEYDGYHFYPGTAGVYNPFSVLNTLANKVFRDYWFESGTPSFLVKVLQENNYPLEDLTRETITGDLLGSIDVMDRTPLPLLYQSGYLTLKKYDHDFDEYTLGFPNREVEVGFTRYLTRHYIPQPVGESPFAVSNFVRELRGGDPESFLRRLQSLFADGNYQIAGDEEIYFQNTLYVFFKMLGFYVDVERHTCDGRMDVLVQTPDFIYIIELKVNQSAQNAIEQIEQKQYAAPFASDSRKLFKLGINYNSSRRVIDDWAVA